MKFLSVNKNNLHHLKNFIDNMGSSIKTFRYYCARKPEEVISDHIITLLLFDNDCVGYGHLDMEEDTVWLGICVKQSYQGKGYGKKIMKELVGYYDGDIHLSVDSDNVGAINLYKIFHFKKIRQKDFTVYMKRSHAAHI